MKLSSTWFALILIASALLLNGERSANAESPSPHQTRETHAKAHRKQTAASPVSTPSYKSRPEPTPTTTNNYSYNYNYYRPSAESPPVWFQVLTTIILLGFTGGLWLTSIWQWRAIDEQAKISNKNLLLQFRPKLIVRNIVVDPIEIGEGITPALFLGNYPVNGQFYISNVGDSDAVITEVGCWVEWFQKKLPMKRPYEAKDANAIPFSRTLRPSQSTPCRFEGKVMDPTLVSMITIGQIYWRIYVMGWVQYTDSLKIERRTAFCQAYDADTGRFHPVEDTDYEHAE